MRNEKPMNTADYFKRLTALFILVCALAFPAQAARAAEEPDQGIGQVVYLAGTVVAEQPDGTTRLLDMEKPVMAGEAIVTRTKSSVEIVFNDQSVFSQGPDTRTVLDEFVYSPENKSPKMLLKVGVGTVRYVTGKLVQQNPDGFALELPTATIGIRGTGVFAEVTPQREEAGVLEMTPGHTVTVSTATQTQTISRAGFSVTATPDGRLSPPAPTAPETRARVIQAAPQTTQGERPGAATTSPGELQNRIDAFEAATDRTKSGLAGVGSRPDYGALHNLSLQEEGKRSAENSSESASSTLGTGLGGDATDTADQDAGPGQDSPAAGP